MISVEYAREGFNGFIVFKNGYSYDYSDLFYGVDSELKEKFIQKGDDAWISTHWIENCLSFKTFILDLTNEVEVEYKEQPEMTHLKSLIDSYGRENDLESKEFNELRTLNEIETLDFENINPTFKPHIFQKEHASFAYANKKSCNFSSPGAGKTIIASLLMTKLYDDKITNFVIIGPSSANTAWMKEPLKVIDHSLLPTTYKNTYSFSNRHDISGNNFHEGIEWISQEFLESGKINIFFINLHKFRSEKASKKVIEKFKNCNYATIIDEGHYFKNDSSASMKNLSELFMNSKRTLILTGTPFPRKIEEGNYIPKILWPRLGTKCLNFNHPDDALMKIMPKIFVRKDKNLVENIKKLTIIKEDIEPSEIEKFLMDKLNRYLENLLDSTAFERVDRSLVIRLMQAASNPPSLQNVIDDAINEIYELSDEDKDEDDSTFMIDRELEDNLDEIIKSSEMKRLIESYDYTKDNRFIKLEELIRSKEERLLVWNVFIKTSRRIKTFLRNKFPDREVFIIDGSITGEARASEISRFRRSNNGILIASPATIAESVSLHREVDTAIYFFRNYVGSHWMQSIDRIHRLVGPGEQTREKFVHIIMARDNNKTIDEMIDNNLEKKVVAQNEIFQTIEENERGNNKVEF